jgi:hypothetical protein
MRTEQERLASYRASFLEKVKKWRWEEPKEEGTFKRGRKLKPSSRIESHPRSEGERLVSRNKK